MTFISEERRSDSPYVESIMRGRSIRAGSPIRPAEIHWHMVFVKHQGNALMFLVGPWKHSGVVNYEEGGEVLWIRFKLGAFMPQLPTRNFLDSETILPAARPNAFWLHGSAWPFPDFENADTFVERLVRDDILLYDPVVAAALQGHQPELSLRTLRHRFLRSTGMSQNHIFQFERAQRAAALLRQGVSILDTVHELGYFDQPHLTRSLKRFIGATPARLCAPE